MEIYEGDKLIKDAHRDSHKDLEALRKEFNEAKALKEARAKKKRERLEDGIIKMLLGFVGTFLSFVGYLIFDYFKRGGQ